MKKRKLSVGIHYVKMGKANKLGNRSIRKIKVLKNGQWKIMSWHPESHAEYKRRTGKIKQTKHGKRRLR